jgi:site-specific recombinase XerD
VVISERKGHVHVHAGKGDKDRSVPLNADARAALVTYLPSFGARASRDDRYLHAAP